METMENQSCVFLGIKVKPGPIERYKIENFTLDNTVDTLKSEAEKKANIPSTSLELIHHGKILKDNVTLQDSGVKSGEMVHVVKKKEPAPTTTPVNFSEAELQALNASLRTLGCTPNAPGWTRAMQLLNDETAMAEIMEHAPSLAEDCVTLSILHEVELLAALGANVPTMRRGADAHPDLVVALRHLMRLVRNRTSANDSAPTPGFSYSLDALSDDEDAEVGEEGEEGEGLEPHEVITQEQLAAALQAATEAVFSQGRGGHEGLLRLLQAAGEPGDSAAPASTAPQPTEPPRVIITPEMFSVAITDALNRTMAAGGTAAAGGGGSARGAGGAGGAWSVTTAEGTGSTGDMWSTGSAGGAGSVGGGLSTEGAGSSVGAWSAGNVEEAGSAGGPLSAGSVDGAGSAGGTWSVEGAGSAGGPWSPGSVERAGSSGGMRSAGSAQAAGSPGCASASAGTPMDQSTMDTIYSSPVPSSVASPSPGPSGTGGPAGSGGAGGPSKPKSEFEAQLLRMHELGLCNDDINVRALRICSGEVNEAINLVLNGVIEN